LDLPLGTISKCLSLVTLGKNESGGLEGGDAKVTLRQKDGIVTADIGSDTETKLLTGTLSFQVATSTTAFALPGQSFFVDVASPQRTELRSGSLALVNGNFVVSLATGPGQEGSAWLQCLVPYAACPVEASDSSATFPSGAYGHCVGSVEPKGSIVLEPNGATVKATLEGDFFGGAMQATYDLTVVAPGVATLRGTPRSGAPSTCGGGGTNASLRVDGKTLFFDVGLGGDWNVWSAMCFATDQAVVTVVPISEVSAPAGSESTSVQSGRTVASCSDCRSAEVCVAATSQADFCGPSPSDRGSTSPVCPSGYSYDASNNCCGSNGCCLPSPSTLFACWPLPDECEGKASCACASGIITLACGADTCSTIKDGLACLVEP
jgi:hypothetical protein